MVWTCCCLLFLSPFCIDLKQRCLARMCNKLWPEWKRDKESGIYWTWRGDYTGRTTEVCTFWCNFKSTVFFSESNKLKIFSFEPHLFGSQWICQFFPLSLVHPTWSKIPSGHTLQPTDHCYKQVKMSFSWWDQDIVGIPSYFHLVR